MTMTETERNGARDGAYRPNVERPRPLHADILQSASRGAGGGTRPEAGGRTSSDGEDNELFVGPNIKLRGEISSCDTVVVQGLLEASMNSRHVEIAKGGVLLGDIAVDTARIAGCFEGSLAVREHLDVLDGGSVSGVVRYRSFAVEDGGRIEGDVKTTAEEDIRR
jgi:cytoskeletal protein CcmA (bactofilin family)